MSHYVFRNVGKADREYLKKGNFIVVLQTVRVPPHLLIAVNGRTWSISVSGQLPGEPLEKLLSYIDRKEVPTIFSELILPSLFTEQEIRTMLDEVVNQYPEVHANEISCLHPIRDFAVKVFGDSSAQARFIFELIPAIQAAGGLGKHYGFYTEDYLDADGNLAMPLYTAEDVARATEEAKKQYEESSK